MFPSLFSERLSPLAKKTVFIRSSTNNYSYQRLKMANISSKWIRGSKFTNLIAQGNVNFIQRGFAHVPNRDSDKIAQSPDAKEIFPKEEDANMAEKTTSNFVRKSKTASGGETQMFSTAATASVKGPDNPPKDKGSPPIHNK